MMKPVIFETHLENPQGYIDNFKNWKYPMLIEQDETWKRELFTYDDTNKIFINKYGGWMKNQTLDFIVIIIDWRYWINFGSNHSFLSKGENVIYAGEIKFFEWEPSTWTNRSGHYKPDLWDKAWKERLEEAFKNRFNTTFKDKFMSD